MSIVSAGDIFKLCTVAFKLWEFAFSKVKNAEKLYADFGLDIQHLEKNLRKLGQVILDVTKQIPSLSAEEQKWDLKTLPEICGDFSKTLIDCKRLLADKSKFSHSHDNFIYNIQWNLTIDSEVVRLKDRVAFHNIKILAILKPLELKLILDLKSDIRDLRTDVTFRLTEVQEELRKLRGNPTGNADEANLEATASPSADPEVPLYLQVKFDAAVKAANSELQDDTQFPLAKGVNAFHHHFEQGTCKFQPEFTPIPGDYLVEQTPEPTQYLNLMKSIWVIQKVKKGKEYADAATDRLWDCYVNELEKKCQREFQRFTSSEQPRKRLNVPDRINLDLLRPEEFRIWLDDDEEEDDFQPGTDSLKQILHVLLSSPRNRKQELILVRHTEVKLEMQILSSKTTGPPNRQATITDIDLRKTQLVPLYATPMAAPEAFNITFKGNVLSGRTSVLSFLGLKDLIDFQQAITGYKVVYNETDVKLLTYISTGRLRGGKQTFERGRVQIWTPRPLERSPPFVQENSGSQHHRMSLTTISSIAPSLGRSFTTLCTSPVQAEGSSSVSFQMPGVPICIFYLGPDQIDSEEMSFLTLEMDNETLIKSDRCACSKKKIDCIHSTIERSGELVARRVKATGENEELNLALLGTYQKPKYPPSDLVKKMRYVQLEFKAQDKRLRFERKFNETKEIFNNKVWYYHEDMRRARGTHVV